MTKLDPTVMMFLIVFGLIVLSVFTKNIQVIAISGLALILALVMLKILYLELSVIIAIAVLLFFALMGDEVAGFVGKVGDVVGDISLFDRLSEEDKEKVRQAYADQFAPEGCYIVVNHYDVNQWLDMLDEDYRERWFIVPDKDYQIWIYGADTISDYYIGDESPTIEQQIKDVRENNKIWVKVRVPELGNVWVHVKAKLHEMSWWLDPNRECVYCSGEKHTCHPEIDWLEVLT